MDLVAFSKIRFLEFKCNMVIDDHPALIVSSDVIRYDINISTNFLDKCSFHRNFYSNCVCFMECDIPLQDTSGFFTFIQHITFQSS